MLYHVRYDDGDDEELESAVLLDLLASLPRRETNADSERCEYKRIHEKVGLG